MKILNEDQEEERKLYENITLEPGEKKEIDSYYSPKAVARFQYLFEGK